ncbi:hypothetical protein [Paenibacillus sp. QZ-Y1]|uniref:hypothetical protein n=1 Tax=Paenibacillus sp. QZ-Y1 TaxID=3414511 RepID=UPI003F791BC3
MKTQMASTPTLKGEDAKRLLDSLRNKPTERSRMNAEKLKEHFLRIEETRLLKNPEITLDTPEKVELFNKLLYGKVNEELKQRIKNTPSIPRRKPK